MRIADAGIDLMGRYSQARHVEQREELRVWVGRPGEAPADGSGRPSLGPAAVSDLSEAALGLARGGPMETEVVHEGDAAEDRLDANLLILMRLVEEMTGQKMRLADPSMLGRAEAPAARPDGPPPGFGVVYERLEERVHVEHTSFSASGTVTTEDGEELAFELEFEMTRVEVSVERFSLRAGADAQAIDPLVLNFAGPMAELLDDTFQFDLNGDGELDQVPMPGLGSAFLALDEDGDGRIDDGSELFGPSTGDGFAELSRHDADGNGFIDEADPVFDRLSLYEPASPGRLASLRDRGVGALYLDAARTPWDVNGGDGGLLGRLGETSVWLGDDGEAGTLQHLDLVV